MQDADTQETLADHLRTVLADPGPHAAEAVPALRVLLDLGWVEADRVEDLLGGSPSGGHAVRSLAEDLAVARTRARTATDRSKDLRRRTEAVLARSADLRSDVEARVRSVEPAAAQDRVAVLQREVDQLRQALESRPRIEHAVGIVMQLIGCDEDVAWDVLSRLSQHTNVKVRVMAEALVVRVGSGGGIAPELGDALRELARERWPGRSRR